MKSVSSIYLVMGHNYESDESYPIKGFRTEPMAEKFKAEMRDSNPSGHFYWVVVEIEWWNGISKYLSECLAATFLHFYFNSLLGVRYRF
nr:hypothetical protein [Providencia rettgeri]